MPFNRKPEPPPRRVTNNALLQWLEQYEKGLLPHLEERFPGSRKKTIERHLHELARQGLISMHRSTGSSHRYVYTTPVESAEPPKLPTKKITGCCRICSMRWELLEDDYRLTLELHGITWWDRTLCPKHNEEAFLRGFWPNNTIEERGCLFEIVPGLGLTVPPDDTGVPDGASAVADVETHERQRVASAR